MYFAKLLSLLDDLASPGAKGGETVFGVSSFDS